MNKLLNIPTYGELLVFIEQQEKQIEALTNAIKQTLEENGHLADGDNCTLIVLKRAIGSLD